jgi:hypothetical protein
MREVPKSVPARHSVRFRQQSEYEFFVTFCDDLQKSFNTLEHLVGHANKVHDHL